LPYLNRSEQVPREPVQIEDKTRFALSAV
jgi:hypothetical protein